MIKLFSTKSSLTPSKAKDLVKRFFDGETSLDEEAKLYEYFNSGNVSADLQQYSQMFAWYGNKLSTPAKKHSKKWYYVAAAASIAILTIVSIHQYTSTQLTAEEQRLAEIYAGSYIIRDGKKITDMKKVLPVILQEEKNYNSLLAEIRKQDDQTTDHYQQFLDDVLSDIDDEEMRNDILNELK